jgi:hypothetical protein
MSFVMKMAVKAVAPYLGKITEGLDAMAREYNVPKCFLMIMEKQIPNEKSGALENKAVIVFMGQGEGGTLDVCKDKEGKPAEYPIEKILDLIMGEKLDDEDDE